MENNTNETDVTEDLHVEEVLHNESTVDHVVVQEEKKEPKNKRPKGYLKTSHVLIGFLALVLLNNLTVFYFGTETTNEDMSKIEDAYDTIVDNYYGEIDNEALVDGAIDGMVNSLGDQHSAYMPVEESEDFNQDMEGSYEGIGIQIVQQEDQIVIMTPMKGSPAEEAGLKAGDVILAVDGESLTGKTTEEVVEMISGEKGTPVELEIYRPSEDTTFTVEIIRDEISMYSVESEMLEENTAYISISKFTQTTPDEFEDALQSMEEQGMESLILDLRNNPGGLLSSAIDVANQFVPEGEIIVQEEYSNGKVKQEKADDNGGYKVDVPVVVLVNEGSASASEIVAGALQQTTDAVVMGTQTYGKGTIQRSFPLEDGSAVKVTVGHWLTPDGTWIHEEGITPDVVVELPAYAQAPFINPDEVLAEGMNSESVESAELMLEALGYNPGSVDSKYDEDTKTAVEAFQSDNGLDQTGEITGDTTTQLMKSVMELTVENDVQKQAAIDYLNKE